MSILPFSSFIVFTKKSGQSKGSQLITHQPVMSKYSPLMECQSTQQWISALTSSPFEAVLPIAVRRTKANGIKAKIHKLCCKLPFFTYSRSAASMPLTSHLRQQCLDGLLSAIHDGLSHRYWFDAFDVLPSPSVFLSLQYATGLKLSRK